MKARPSKKRAYHHGDLRRALVDATLAMVEETGPRGFSLREVARRAGVSHAAPYRHFADRDALLAAVAEDGFQKLTQSIRRAMDAAPDIVSAFRESGLAYIAFAEAHPAYYKIMFSDAVPIDPLELGKSEPRFATVQRAARDAFQTLFDGVIGCQAAGWIRPGDPKDAAMVAWTMCHGLSLLVIDGHLPERAIAVTFEAMCFGLMVQPAPPQG
jgi:AcrR family transcriptional regulator